MHAAQNAGLQGGAKESAAGPSAGSSSLAAWGPWELHRLVAHFLAARFPILLALNKVSRRQRWGVAQYSRHLLHARC